MPCQYACTLLSDLLDCLPPPLDACLVMLVRTEEEHVDQGHAHLLLLHLLLAIAGKHHNPAVLGGEHLTSTPGRGLMT